MNTESRKQLIRRAASDPKLLGKLKAAHARGVGRVLSAAQRTDLTETLRDLKGFRSLNRTAASKYPTVTLTSLPTMSPQQTNAMVDYVANALTEIEAVKSQIESAAPGALKKLSDAEGVAKEGKKNLEALGKQLTENENILVQTKKATLKFLACEKKTRPGVKQMLGSPEATKPQDKAGALIAEIENELGPEIAESVQAIIEATWENLTSTSRIAKSLQVVVKSASVPNEVLKTAGVVDVLVGVGEWLTGLKSSVFQRLTGLKGTFSTFLKKMAVRTGIMKKKNTRLQKSVSALDKALDKLNDIVA